MKKTLVAFVLSILAMAILLSWPKTSTLKTNESPLVPPATHRSEQPDLHDYAVKGRVPAYHKQLPALTNLPPTLPPEAFTGNKRLAYQAAKDIPETLAQLPCYCHCDRSQNHKSLHSCFESEHGENCGICINEALMAHNLQKKGISVVEIRKQIIAAFGQN